MLTVLAHDCTRPYKCHALQGLGNLSVILILPYRWCRYQVNMLLSLWMHHYLRGCAANQHNVLLPLRMCQYSIGCVTIECNVLLPDRICCNYIRMFHYSKVCGESWQDVLLFCRISTRCVATSQDVWI